MCAVCVDDNVGTYIPDTRTFLVYLTNIRGEHPREKWNWKISVSQ